MLRKKTTKTTITTPTKRKKTKNFFFKSFQHFMQTPQSKKHAIPIGKNEFDFFSVLFQEDATENGWRSLVKKNWISLEAKQIGPEDCAEAAGFDILRSSALIEGVHPESACFCTMNCPERIKWDTYLSHFCEVENKEKGDKVTGIAKAPLMSAREFVFRRRVKQVNADQFMCITRSCWSDELFDINKNPLANVRKGSVWAEYYFAVYLFTRTETGCKLDIISLMDFGGSLPKWVFNQIAKLQPVDFANAVKKAALKIQKDPVALDHVYAYIKDQVVRGDV